MTRRFLFALAVVATASSALIGYSTPASAQLAATPMLLVADPQLQDPMFRQSVVLVTRHGRSRPIGVILNRPQAADPANSGSASEPRFVGGPVSPQSVVCLFQAEGGVAANLLALGDNLYLGFGAGVVDDLAHRQPPLPRLRVFNGFATWVKGQLENEIARGDWLPLPLEIEMVFRPDTASMWQDLLAKARRRAI